MEKTKDTLSDLSRREELRLKSRINTENEIKNLYEMVKGKLEIAATISFYYLGWHMKMNVKTRRIEMKIYDSQANQDSLVPAMYVGFQYFFNKIKTAPNKLYPRTEEVYNEMLSFKDNDTFMRHMPNKEGVWMPWAWPGVEYSYNPEGPSGLFAMHLIESAGIDVEETCEPEVLADYLQAKANKSFVLNQWIDAATYEVLGQRLFVAEDFVGHPGFTDKVSLEIFGRKPERNNESI